MADSDCTRFAGLYGPTFQARRLEALSRDEHRCCACNHDGSLYRLEVHHRTYERGNSPLLSDLYTYCTRCHDLWTSAMRGDRYGDRGIAVPEHVRVSPASRPYIPTRVEPATVEIRPTTVVRIQLPEKRKAQVQELESRTCARPNF